MNTIEGKVDPAFGNAYNTCPKCGCGIVFQQQQSLDKRCADCFRLDRLESILDRVVARLKDEEPVVRRNFD